MDLATVAVRFALYVDLATLFGLPLFGLYALRRDEVSSRIATSFVAICAALGAIGVLISLANIAVMAKAMTGASAYTELQSHVFEMIVTGTDFGAAWAVRLVALFLCVAIALFGRRWPKLQFAILSAAGGVALSTLAWGGHGAMDDGVRRYVHLASDIAHLIAAGAWVGALIAFVLLSRMWGAPGNVAVLSRTSNGFAQIGTLVVVTLTITGAVNYGLIVGPEWPVLSLASYGGLLAIKLALFGAMLVLAAANRFHLSPRLERAMRSGDHAGAVRSLRRSLMMETSAAALILALVASLGILSPVGA
ncbi:copper homeostasis membrane protein CopD [Cupriavidus gilardii]|uniref:copper homeostasis membrane protein CopD n=1 Tax=Cupriavidus TaxID=106589 RepID=UPI0011ED1AF6|nr:MULTISPECIES: copper homeostasis membrane protein CopD [Cupriavidus]KAA0178781.1 copper homeostasis membrane protein CopD [Cupriavidus gilardii]MBO4120641.1 copper homeostasis membrane protein CopD [Cupriavidus gilardii]MCA7082497.1 copper homeostasis membrane protein CopD [Cupriavidus sp. DB3]MCT9119127.1 copper homeostasis membrane protein CopD [Cupriavidus gilardii]MCT9124961.1 copper homeostasis membrane protein CopD [Cupriavidus gilardii]